MKLEARGPIKGVVEVRVVQGEGPGFFLGFQKKPGEEKPVLIFVGRYDKTRLHEEDLTPPQGLLSEAQRLATEQFQKASTSRHNMHITGRQLPLL